MKLHLRPQRLSARHASRQLASTNSVSAQRNLQRDSGMTLPELLISVVVMAVIVGALAAAMTVTFRQVGSTTGRINLSQSEQAIDTWLPADLRSTDVSRTDLPAGQRAVNTDPAAVPCGACVGVDLSGGNALQLSWTTREKVGDATAEVLTSVQYQYIQAQPGQFHIQRIACQHAFSNRETCTTAVIVRDAVAPPADVRFDPATDRPVWAMNVQDPADEVAADGTAADGTASNAAGDGGGLKYSGGDARQVVVTVDGGGIANGRGGGEHSVTLAAGGVRTSEINADDFTAPSFSRARSRCGGRITVIIDDSGSIGSDVSDVKAAVDELLNAFRGTPTEFQLIQFSTYSNVIEPGEGAPPASYSPVVYSWSDVRSGSQTWNDSSPWNAYVKMTDDARVSQLVTSMRAALSSSGGTNWEEALFRALRSPDGSPSPTRADRIIMFTDGQPSSSRVRYRAQPAGGTAPAFDFNDGVYTNNNWFYSSPGRAGTEYDMYGVGWSQQAWDRADAVLDQHPDLRSERFTMIALGPGLNDYHDWIHNEAVYENRAAAPAKGVPVRARDLAARLVSLNPEDIDQYDAAANNSSTANYYYAPAIDPNMLAQYMKNSILTDCGGSVTLQTRLVDGTAVDQEFVYENATYRDDRGVTVPDIEPRRVSTSSRFRTGTFDFSIPANSNYFTVDIVPQELETLGQFEPVGWSCRAGADSRAATPITIDQANWEGISVAVAANEAVACILTVRRA